MCCRSVQCLIITDIQIFHCEILPWRCGATGRNPSGAANQTAAVGRWRLEGKELFKEERRVTMRMGGHGREAKALPGKQGVNKLCWQSNIPRLHAHACIQNRWIYYGTASEAAASDFKVTQPRGELRNSYFIIFKGNLQSQYLWLQAQLNEPKKSVNGSLFTSGIRFHS